MQSRRLIRCLPWAVAALLALSCTAQVLQKPGTFPGRQDAASPPQATANSPGAAPQPVRHHQAVPAQVSESPALPDSSTPGNPAPVSPSLPPSLLDKPAQPAQITLHDGLLSIHADNSSLSAILKQLASSSGMSVDGFQKDQRVFGTYGPGKPGDILSSLLQDAGYNFLMVGATGQGTPRELVLTARSNSGPTVGPSGPEAQQDDDADSGNDNSGIYPPVRPVYPPMRPVPGGLPPQPMNSGSPSPNGPVKTPAEIIQELQRMRQQQQQQNPQ